ncbi:MAG: hypothetical protein DMG30_18840 [Acidobacteria bacterium]|nr:MAG: hypothetical protein DMG30_18840 [Acidobacteriota bacterium]
MEGAGRVAWRSAAEPLRGLGVGVSSSSTMSAAAGAQEATNRESTSSEAARDAAAVWARKIGGSALVGRLLPQAATKSLSAWFSSSAVR